MKKRVIGKVVGISVAVILFCILAAVAILYTYQDKIIRLFVAEANKHITTQVNVSTISLSLFEKFPQAAVSLQDIEIIEAVPGSIQPLAKAKKVFCTFNLFDVLKGRYQVRELYMEDGQVLVRILADGTANYQIYNSTDTAAASQDFSFNLETINLKNVAVTYSDEQLKQTYSVHANQLASSLGYDVSEVRIHSEGDILVNTLKLDKSEYFKNKAVTLKTSITIDKPQQNIAVVPSVIKIGKAEYLVQGNIDYTRNTFLDLKLTGKNTNIQSLLSLLPESITKEFRQYKSEGDVYFSGLVKGTVSKKESPFISFDFGGKNTSFFHPEYKQKLEKVSFNGSFTNGNAHHLKTSVLELKDIKGILKGRPFSGGLVYKNFQDPTVNVQAEADLDLESVLAVFPSEHIQKGSGFAKVKIDFSGNINNFKRNPGNATIQTAGDISLRQVSLQFAGYPHPVNNVSGNFMFRKNDLAVSDLHGTYGDSDFALNGLFKNMLAWTLLDNQRLLIEADFESRFLNFDQLLSQHITSQTDGKSKSTEQYHVIVSPLLAFDLNAKVDKLRFRRFNSRNIRGTVKLNNQVVTTPNISFNSIGGRFSVKGTIDARNRNNIKVNTTTKLENMQVDSLFYVFEDFGQNFLVQRHLRGDLTADIISDLYFDSYLNPKTDQMEAEVNALIRNGQLRYFEPMQKLSVFIDRSELANMQFSELSNKFWIQNKTVYIPEMEIRSNLSRVPSISFSGTHTFDQQMEYKFKIPFPKSQKRDKDELFGRVEDTDVNAGNIFLTLKGNENDYKISYDKARVATKIQDDLKKEKQEITDILKGRKPEPKKKEEVEINKDEYFNF